MKHKITGILLILIVAILLPVGAFAQESGFESPSALEMDEFQLDQDYGKGIIRQIYEERLNQELSCGDHRRTF